MMRACWLAALAISACSRAPETGSKPTPGATTPRDAATTVVPGPRAVQLALGSDHTCVLLADGLVRCWGLGTEGRLGTGNTETIGDDEPASRGKPVALGGPATAIAAGGAHTCALLASKRVRCWGRGRDGELGYGTPDNVGDDETPASVGDVPLSGDVAAIAAGFDATCALMVDGSVRCWGMNREGRLGYDGRKQPYRLGDGEAVDSMPPIRFDRRVIQLAMDRGSTCVLFEGGAVRCWGGVLGSADLESAAVKRSDIDVGAAVKRLAGTSLMCAITVSSGARCWGFGRVLPHEVGVHLNAEEGQAVVADVGDLPLPGPIESIALSGDHGCILLGDNTVRCWGDRRLGILGVPPGGVPPGSVVADFVPVAKAGTVDIGAPVGSLAVGSFHSCVITIAGGVRCWGMAQDGRLGYGTAENVGEERTPAAAGDVPL